MYPIGLKLNRLIFFSIADLALFLGLTIGSLMMGWNEVAAMIGAAGILVMSKWFWTIRTILKVRRIARQVEESLQRMVEREIEKEKESEKDYWGK